MAKAKKKQSNSPDAKRMRDKRAAAKTAGKGSGDKPDVRETPPGVNAAGAKGDDSEAERLTKNSVDAANEIARRRHEPGAADPEGDGPQVGRVDNRTDSTAETQQIPRPARPLTPPNAVADRIAKPELREGEEDDGSLPGTARFAKVRALKMGYFDNVRRRAGDVFWIHNAQEFSDEWMEYAGASDPEKITTGNQELRRKHREIIEQKKNEATAGTGSANVLGAGE